MAAGTVLLFAGQGAQFVGMGQSLAQQHTAARAIFAQADDALEFSLSKLCWHGPHDQLTRTEFAQPAILTHSMAAWAVAQERGNFQVYASAGHSLGEWSALVAADALAFADAVRLVHLRGQLMQAAVAQGQGAMAAILGLSADQVVSACSEAAQGQVVSVAADNDSAHLVIAGHAQAVHRASALCLSRGALRAVALAVSAPFHCALMQPAASGLALALENVTLATPRWPVRSTIVPNWHGADVPIRQVLVDQLTAPVLWRSAIAALATAGATAALAPGPTAAVPGLVKRTARGLKVHVLSESSDFDALEAL
ncbi:MAG: [acyl-carrier-protein] S-malonyltransferase [Myxococcales bacterium]|nr:[acyl-carrier-protein] S-malonyltransferase [Myxococcales bacterium]